MRRSISPRFAARRRVAALVACAAVVLGACSKSSSQESGPAAADEPATTTTADAPGEPELAFEIGDIELETLGVEPAPADEALTEAVLDTLDAYATGATLSPLVDGEPSTDLESLFLFTIADRVAPGGADRAALTDDAVPPATGDVEIETEPVTLSGLQNGLGGYVLAAATFDYSVSTEVEGGPLTIRRLGDLYFSETDDGWVVSAYDVAVTRTTDDGAETTAVTGGTTTTAGEDGKASE